MRYLLVMLAVLMLFAGCSNKKNPKGTPSPGSKPITDEATINRYSENEKAKYIANNILKDQNVKKVVVVVTGKTALIGIDADTTKANPTHYKDIAVQKTREVDPNISKVEVTTDKAMYNRISKLNEDILNGKPLGGIAEEFLTLIKRSR